MFKSLTPAPTSNHHKQVCSPQARGGILLFRPWQLFVLGFSLSVFVAPLMAQTSVSAPLAWWLFDKEDGSVILDYSGNNNHAEILAPEHVGSWDSGFVGVVFWHGSLGSAAGGPGSERGWFYELAEAPSWDESVEGGGCFVQAVAPRLHAVGKVM